MPQLRCAMVPRAPYLQLGNFSIQSCLSSTPERLCSHLLYQEFVTCFGINNKSWKLTSNVGIGKNRKPPNRICPFIVIKLYLKKGIQMFLHSIFASMSYLFWGREKWAKGKEKLEFAQVSTEFARSIRHQNATSHRGRPRMPAYVHATNKKKPWALGKRPLMTKTQASFEEINLFIVQAQRGA